MQLETISMPREAAAEKWREYIEAQKRVNSKEIADLKRLYNYLKQGKKVIDIYGSFKKCPLNEDGEPRLAIAPVNAPSVRFRKLEDGAGSFRDSSKSGWSRRHKDNIDLPTHTFPNWKTPNGVSLWNSNRRDIIAPLPTIPAKYIPKSLKSDYGNYYLLWEIEKWEPIAPRDPILLRRITSNLFIKEAQWALTKLERAFVNGRLAR